jgi:hypothetical protein
MAFDRSLERDDDYRVDDERGPTRPDRYNQVAGWYDQYLGRNGNYSSDEISSWANNPNDDAWVENQLKNSQEAQNYRNSRSGPPPPPGGGGGGNDWSTGDWDANRVRSYFQSRGVSPFDSSPDYWAGKWNEWGKNDPAEFVRRLGIADEFTGVGPNYDWQAAQGGGGRSGGSGFTNSSSSNGGGPRVGGIVQNPVQVSNDLINLLTSRAKQSLAIDPKTDSVIRPQVDNAAATQERSRRNYMNDLAESSNPYATGAMNTAATQTSERIGQNVSGLESQLVQNELGSRREEIQNALNSLGALLTADQQLALQSELGHINAALQKQQLDNSFTLGQGQLGLGWGQLGSNNDQFAARYNLDATNQASYWDAVRRGDL